MYSSVEDFMAMVEHKNPNEPEFHQAVHEVVESLWSFLQENQDYIYSGVMQRVVEPERVIMFRVPWRNDKGDAEVKPLEIALVFPARGPGASLASQSP